MLIRFGMPITQGDEGVKISSILRAIYAVSSLVLSFTFEEKKKQKSSFPNVSKMLEKELEKELESIEKELYL